MYLLYNIINLFYMLCLFDKYSFLSWPMQKDAPQQISTGGPKTKESSWQPQNDILNIKNVFYHFFLPVGDPCRGKNPGKNKHFIDFSVK